MKVIEWMAVAAVVLQFVLTPTLPGSSARDLSQPSVVINRDGSGYQTIPGTQVQDFSKPAFQVETPTGMPVVAPLTPFGSSR